MSVNDPHNNDISRPLDGSAANLPVVPVTSGHLAAAPAGGFNWNEGTAGDEGINLVRLIHALRRRWPPAIGFGLITGLLVVCLLYFFFPRNYEAEALVRVRRDKQVVLSQGLFGNDQRDYDTFKQTQSALMKSTFVINAAFRKPGIAQLPMIKAEDDPSEWLAEHLRVSNPGDSEILSVILKGEDTDQIEKIVNAVVESYLQEIVQSEREADLERLDILKRESRNNMQNIKESQELISRLAQEVGSSDSEEAGLQHRLEFDSLMRMQSSRDNVQERLQQVEMDLLVMGRRAEAAYTPSEFEVEDYMEMDPWYSDAKARLVFAQEEQRSMTVRGGTPSPRLQFALQTAYSDVQRLKSQLRERVEARIRRNGGLDESKIKDVVGMLQTERMMLVEQLKQQNERFIDQKVRLERSIGTSAELELRKVELVNMMKMMETVAEEMDTLDLNLKTKPRISVIQPAIVPEVSDWILRFSLFGCAFAAAMGITVFGVAMWDYQSKHVNVPEDINSETTIRVVGSLPALDRRGWSVGGLRGSSLESVLIESIDSIRTALLCHNGDNPVNVVMVTSATAQEGKTTLAGQLAISLARSGRRTLLVDGDLHNPQQHYVFGLPFGRGFCELLRNEATVDEVVQHVSAEGLSLISAGYCDQASLRALARERAQNVVKQLRSDFDFVVVDGGPVLVGADPLLLGQYADTALISVRRDVSRIPKVNEACDRLRAVGVHIMGAVLSGAGVEFRQRKLELAYEDNGEIEEAVDA